MASRVVRHAAWRARRARLALDSLGRQTTRGARLLPNFFVIGAQKCGTTSLFAYLLQHEDVAGCKHKEVHYFDRHYERGLGWYRGHFPLRLGPRPRAVGEATPDYVFHPHAPARLHAFDPEARLIAIFREPVARALSHYHEARAVGVEPLPFSDAIAAEPERIRGEEERLLSDPAYEATPLMHFSYLARGRYAEQLERWLRFFPPEQLLVLRSEDLACDPEVTVTRAFEFLGLAPQRSIVFRRHNERSYGGMDPSVREELLRYFDEPNRRLYQLLGRDLGWPRPERASPTPQP